VATLRRQSLIAYRAPLRETTLDLPQPQGSEVLLRIERCGVCHSDLHIQDGYFTLAGDKTLDITAGRALPFTLGHEIAGAIDGRPRGRTGRRDGAWPQSRGLSVDRLPRLPGLPPWRGKLVRGTAPSRDCC
jgi:NADPH:quinone reductase-like Zn-dependent oxidoreductase